VGSCALRLAKLQERGDWAKWVMTIHRSLGLMPSSLLIDLLEELELAKLPDVRGEIDAFVDHWRDKADGQRDPDLGGLARLERLTR
jgi:hypothetical protein